MSCFSACAQKRSYFVFSQGFQVSHDFVAPGMFRAFGQDRTVTYIKLQGFVDMRQIRLINIGM